MTSGHVKKTLRKHDRVKTRSYNEKSEKKERMLISL